MKKRIMLAIALVIVGSIFLVVAANAQGGTAVSRGGLLYDKWWKITGADAPTGDHPLWANQTTDTSSGDSTWRCKACHGWDYLGKDGAYGSGSHFTGFPGVYDAAQSQTVEELAAALKGATNADHDFSSVMNDAAINDLVTFLKEGVINVREYIDYDAKAPKSADADHGKGLFDGLCAICHGADGTAINWGSEDEPGYVGTVASGNPWETLHKDRFGQPGTGMPSTIDLGWSVQDAVDVLAYAQTLPTGEEAPAELPVTGGVLFPLAAVAMAAMASGLVALGAGLVLRRKRR